jgi:hypothetical protein
MEVSGQFQVRAAIPPGKEPLVPTGYEVWCVSQPVRTTWRNKKSCPSGNRIQEYSLYPVGIPTVLTFTILYLFCLYIIADNSVTHLTICWQRLVKYVHSTTHTFRVNNACSMIQAGKNVFVTTNNYHGFPCIRVRL